MRTPLAVAGLTAALALTLSACGGDDDDTISSADRDKASSAALAHVGAGAVTDAGRGDGDDPYAYEVEVTLPNGTDIDVELDDSFAVTNSPPTAADFAAEVPTQTPTQTPASASAPDDDRALTGDTLTRATDAALKATQGGRVTETSSSDDSDHVYEVDVLLPSGEDVTVELDEAFTVTTIDR
ncbi:MAG: PepSY domain-containing protein [Aeromicrobium sp.]